jgi:hypothetical protein
MKLGTHQKNREVHPPFITALASSGKNAYRRVLSGGGNDMRTTWWVVLSIGLTSATSAVARADLHFAQTTVAVGDIRGGILSRRFAFTNDGPEKIEITGLHASCGCTKPRLEPFTYAPGAKGELEMEINTLSQSAGDHAWSVQVIYRANGELREQTVRLTGHVVAEVQVQPAAVTVFTDHPFEHTLVVTDIRSKPLKITEVQSSARFLIGHLGEPSRDDKGRWTCAVKVEIAADCPEGRHEERIDLITSDADYTDLRVPVIVVKRAKQRLSATPNPVVVSVPAGQSAPSRLIVIRDQDEQPVVIDRVEADHAALSCTWSEGANTPGAVRVRVDPKGLGTNSLQSAIHIYITKPIETTLTLPVQVTAP